MVSWVSLGKNSAPLWCDAAALTAHRCLFGWKEPGTGGGRDRGRSSRGGLDLDDVPARRLIGAAQRTKHGHGCLIPLPLLSFAFTMEWLCTCVVLLPEEEAILAGELGEMVRL